MKAVTGALASLMLLTAVVQAAPTTKPPMGTLSDEDISELLTSWKCPKTGKTLSFHVGVGRQTLNPTKDKSALRKYQKSGEVPFRVTAELIESKERHGKVESTRESGNCYIYILDAEGALVLKKTSSLSKMCPT